MKELYWLYVNLINLMVEVADWTGIILRWLQNISGQFKSKNTKNRLDKGQKIKAITMDMINKKFVDIFFSACSIVDNFSSIFYFLWSIYMFVNKFINIFLRVLYFLVLCCMLVNNFVDKFSFIFYFYFQSSLSINFYLFRFF